mmetsp:Transcript_33986/g.54528  ORF Transcript_33986/g.54528 Transcript_33986/m.54528 type:complete len:212 (+) Transcript_33986:230-865(+)
MPTCITVPGHSMPPTLRSARATTASRTVMRRRRCPPMARLRCMLETSEVAHVSPSATSSERIPKCVHTCRESGRQNSTSRVLASLGGAMARTSTWPTRSRTGRLKYTAWLLVALLFGLGCSGTESVDRPGVGTASWYAASVFRRQSHGTASWTTLHMPTGSNVSFMALTNRDVAGFGSVLNSKLCRTASGVFNSTASFKRLRMRHNFLALI